MLPYVEVFEIGNMKLTSVVVDQADFDAFVLELGEIMSDFTPLQMDVLRTTKCLPLMSRGSKTNVFFTRWGVKTDYLSVIVRGSGGKVLDQLK